MGMLVAEERGGRAGEDEVGRPVSASMSRYGGSRGVPPHGSLRACLPW